MRALNSVAVLLLMFSAGSLPSQAQTDCSRRSAIVNAVDEHGYAITGLTRERFRVRYRNQVISPSNLQYSFGPRRVVVLLDTSGSMRGVQGNTAKWQTARAAAWSFIAALPQGSKSGLLTFSTTPEVRAALSTDRKASMDWLNSEPARDTKSLKGRTGLFSAIETALSQLQPTEPGDAILVITDAGENASKVSTSAVDHSLRLENVRLFALIVPGSEFARSEEEVRGPEMLWYLARKTGGSVDIVGSGSRFAVYDERVRQRVEVVSQQISKRISAFYSITVDLPENPSKTRTWEVELLDERNQKWKKAVLSYPTEVFPCSASDQP